MPALASGGTQLARLAGPLPFPYETNVMDWGADNTGVSDSTAAIQAALNAAPLGNTVYFPYGSYRITGLVVPRRLTLRGDSWGSILLVEGSAAIGILIDALDGVIVRDLQLQGNKVNELGGAQFGIRIQNGCTNCRVENVKFFGIAAGSGLNNAIYSSDSSDCRFINNHIERLVGTNSGFGYGILASICQRVLILNNRFVYSAAQGRHPVYLSAGTSNSIVKGNICYLGTSAHLTSYAIEAQNWCENNTYEGNLCIDCNSNNPLDGVVSFTQKVRRCLVKGNIIRGAVNQFNGIFSQGGTGVGESRCPENVFAGNLVNRNGWMGCWLFGCDRNLVKGNYFRDNSQNIAATFQGVDVYPASANNPTVDNLVLGNVATGTAQRGPLRIVTADGVRPARTIVRSNEFPAGGARYMLGDGDATQVDECYVISRRVLHTEFQAASFDNYILLFMLGPGEKIESVVTKHEVSFRGGAIWAYNMGVGIWPIFAKYSPTWSVFQVPGPTVFQDQNIQGFENMALAATQILCYVACAGALLNATTQGEAWLHVKVRRHMMPVQ